MASAAAARIEIATKRGATARTDKLQRIYLFMNPQTKK